MRLRMGLVLAALLLAGCGGDGRIASLPGVEVVLGSGEQALTIRAKVAATPQERAEGLMGVKSLPAGRGMLFVFREPVRVSFHMKNTLIPLDIAFIGRGMVLEVYRMEPCKADPCPTTTPKASYEKALEVAAGTFERAGVVPGTKVEIEGTLPQAS